MSEVITKPNDGKAEITVRFDEDGSIDGVGVLYYPSNLMFETACGVVSARDIALEIAATVKKGSVIALPSTRDAVGNLLFDFRIEAGDPGQVEVRPIEPMSPVDT